MDLALDTAQPLRGYAASINRATGVTDPDLLAEIEDFMRDEHRTLDHLTREDFDRCACECWAEVQYMHTPEGMAWAAQAHATLMAGGAL